MQAVVPNFHAVLGLTSTAHGTTQAENNATGIYVNQDPALALTASLVVDVSVALG